MCFLSEKVNSLHLYQIIAAAAAVRGNKGLMGIILDFAVGNKYVRIRDQKNNRESQRMGEINFLVRFAFEIFGNCGEKGIRRFNEFLKRYAERKITVAELFTKNGKVYIPGRNLRILGRIFWNIGCIEGTNTFKGWFSTPNNLLKEKQGEYNLYEFNTRRLFLYNLDRYEDTELWLKLTDDRKEVMAKLLGVLMKKI